MQIIFSDRIELKAPDIQQSWRLDFSHPDLLRRLQAGRKQTLVRACGLHKSRDLKILDCTTGLAQDCLTLAASGAHVQPLERNPVVFRMLLEAFTDEGHPKQVSDALTRCQPPLNMDASDFLQQMHTQPWDVIYIDPMFSGYRRKALPKKSMQLFAQLCGEDRDADALFACALQKAEKRVVVKRAPHAPALATDTGREPDHQIKGNRSRFDIYFTS